MTLNKNKILNFVALAIMASSLSACATHSTTAMGGGQIHDPFENSNRAIFSFNAGVDDVIIHPYS